MREAKCSCCIPTPSDSQVSIPIVMSIEQACEVAFKTSSLRYNLQKFARGTEAEFATWEAVGCHRVVLDVLAEASMTAFVLYVAGSYC